MQTYRNDWHARHRRKTRRAAEIILRHLQCDFEPKSILDIGCGHGDWLRVAASLGITDIKGCDGPWIDKAQLVIPPAFFQRASLDQPLDLGRKYELVLCTEVAEHLAPTASRNLIEIITSHADLVFFGAAIPHQGGYRHVNEQWQSWWAEKFEEQGYRAFDLIRPLVWDAPIDFWYKQNGLVYVRESRVDLLDRAQVAAGHLRCRPPCLNIVHPDHYLRLARYESIAFRPFLHNFPGATWRKIKSMLCDRLGSGGRMPAWLDRP